MAISAYASYAWGKKVSDGDYQTWQSPVAITLSLPTSRGFVTIGGASVCVDRVGTQVYIGDDGKAAIVKAFERFVVTDCERQELGVVFPEVKSP